MTTYYEEPVGGYASAAELRRVDSRVTTVRSDLEEQISSVSSQVGSLQETTYALSSDVEEVKETTADAVEELTETADRQDVLIGRLVRQMAWLEQHATFATGHLAKIDHSTAATKKLATAARTYEVMISQLLTEPQVTQHQHEIRVWEDWLSKQDTLESEAIAAARSALRGVSVVPAGGGPVGAARVESLVKEQKEHTRDKTWLERQALNARKAIADHNALVKQFGTSLTTGKAAHTKLTTEVRNRIEAMLVEPDELPPLWFTLALGQRPPADRHEKWLDAAEALVVYRVMYDVTHKVRSLGPETVSDALQKRLRDRAAGLLKQFELATI